MRDRAWFTPPRSSRARATRLAVANVNVQFTMPGASHLEVIARGALVFWEPGRGPATPGGSIPLRAGVLEVFHVEPGTVFNFVRSSATPTFVYLVVRG